MGQTFTVNDKEARLFLKKLHEKAKKVKGADRNYASTISPLVFQDIMDHFEKEQGDDGPWEPWSESYTMQMNRKGKGGNKILQDTGRLRQSFTPSNYRSVSQGILWFNPAKTKSGFPYAYAHDTGGDTLPRRSFMWLSEETMNKIERVTLDFMEHE